MKKKFCRQANKKWYLPFADETREGAILERPLDIIVRKANRTETVPTCAVSDDSTYFRFDFYRAWVYYLSDA